jgi:hypothetical protein
MPRDTDWINDLAPDEAQAALESLKVNKAPITASPLGCPIGSPSFWPCGRQATIRNFGRAVLYRDDSAVRITERRCPSPRQGTRQLPRIGTVGFAPGGPYFF